MKRVEYFPAIIKWGLMSALFLPLVVANKLLFPFIDGKNFLYRALVEILFLLWVFLAARDSRYWPKKSWILTSAAAFLIVLTLSTIFSVDFNRSFFSNFERMEGLVGHIHLFLFFIMLISVFRNESAWQQFFHVSLAASLITAFYALLQLGGAADISGGDRINATLGNATYFAVYLLFHLFFLIYYFLRSKSVGRKIFYGLIFLLYSFLLFYTASRGVILGFLSGLFVSGVIYGIFSGQKKLRYASFAAVLGIMVLAGTFYLLRESDLVKNNFVLNRFRDVSFSGGESRIMVWNIAIQGFKEHPIFGWGMENFNLVFDKYYDPRLFSQELWFDRAHNALFDWLIAAGLLGLLGYLGMFFSGVWLLWKAMPRDIVVSAIFIGLLTAYFFQNLFVFDQITSYILLFAVLAYIHTISTSQSPIKYKSLSEPWPTILSGSVIVLFIFSFYAVNIKAYLGNRALVRGLIISNGKLEDSVKYFKKAVLLSPTSSEAREVLANAASQIAAKNEFSDEKKRNLISYAVYELENQIALSPSARNYMLLSLIHQSTGDTAGRIAAIEKALEFSPKKQAMIMQLVDGYYQNGDFDKAFEAMRVIMEISPDFPGALSNYVVVAIASGRYELAESLVRESLKNGPEPNYDSLLRWSNLYARAKKFDMVVLIYEEISRRYPSHTETSIHLAEAYYELGEKKKAIAVLKKTMEANPDFEAEGERLIKQIR